jgi:hypothetical protein
MLSKLDVENVFDRIDDEDSETWEYWRDSGNINCWRSSDLDWVLQVAHTCNWVAVSDVSSDGSNDGFEMTGVQYEDDRQAIALIMMAAKSPEEAYRYIRDETPSVTALAAPTYTR